MTTMTIVDSLWRHNENCCYANMRSQGQASCLLTLEFKCHLRYCSSQEVDVSLSHSAVLHYMFVSIISIYVAFLASIFLRPFPPYRSKITGWAIIEELSICRRVHTFLISWGQKKHVTHYNVDLSSWYEFWFATICIDMNVILALPTTMQQFRDSFDYK